MACADGAGDAPACRGCCRLRCARIRHQQARRGASRSRQRQPPGWRQSDIAHDAKDEVETSGLETLLQRPEHIRGLIRFDKNERVRVESEAGETRRVWASDLLGEIGREAPQHRPRRRRSACCVSRLEGDSPTLAQGEGEGDCGGDRSGPVSAALLAERRFDLVQRVRLEPAWAETAVYFRHAEAPFLRLASGCQRGRGAVGSSGGAALLDNTDAGGEIRQDLRFRRETTQ